MRSSDWRRSAINFLINAESSTMSTFTFFTASPTFQENIA
jgi:hypothetical protein